MKPLILAARLAICAFSCTLPHASLVAAPDQHIQLPELIVSAKRVTTSGETSTQPIFTLTAEQIKSTKADTLPQLLSNKFGLQVIDSSGHGARASIAARGFGGNAAANLLILVDGQRLNEPDLAAPNLNAINVADIDHIEVTFGSGSVLYGDQASAGVINIITHPLAKKHLQIVAGLQSHETQILTASFSDKPTDNAAYRIGLKHRQSDGFRRRNQLDLLQLGGQADFEIGQHTLRAQFEAFNEQLELPGALTNQQVDKSRTQAQFNDDDADTVSQLARLKHQYDINEHWFVEQDFGIRHADINGRLSNIDFNQDRLLIEYHPRVLIDFNWQGLDWSAVTGLDIEHTQFELSSVFGDSQSRQWLGGLYTQWTIPITSDWLFEAGGRYAYINDAIKQTDTKTIDNSDSATAYTIGLSYQPNSAWNLSLNHSRGFRFAKPDEQSFTKQLQKSTITLTPQTSRSIDFGARYQNQSTLVQLTAFALWTDDEIDFDPLAPNAFGFTGANNNLDDIRRLGLTAHIDTSLCDTLRLSSDVSLTDARFIQGPFESQKVPFIAPLTAKFGLQWAFLSNYSFNAEASYTGPRFAISDFENQQRRLGGVTVFDAHIGYDADEVSVSAGVKNLFDKDYSDFVSLRFDNELVFFPASDRRFFVEISYTPRL